MATWHIKESGSNGNGTSPNSPWVGVGSINWGNVSEGDRLNFYPGNYGQLGVKKSNISIQRAGGGHAKFYGERAADLPHSLTGDTVSGGVQGQSGITFDSYGGITIEGGKMGGITVHGFNRDGISMYSNSPGNHTIRNCFIHQNGEVGTGAGQIDGHGIRIAGNDNLIEDSIILNNRADAIQNVGGSRVQRLTVRRCVLGNTIDHRLYKQMDFNFRSHNDGIQLWWGGNQCLFEDLVFLNCWHALIVDDNQRGFDTFNNSTIRRIVMIGCKCALRHKNNGSGNNLYEDWLAQKWWSYPDDFGATIEGGTNFRVQGSNNTIRRIYLGGKGSFELYGSGHNVSQIFTDGTLADLQPPKVSSAIAAEVTTLDPQFENPGPVGRSSDNVGLGVTTKSLKPGNSQLDVINVPYFGFLDFLQKASGTVWKTVPKMIRATGGNSPMFGANPTIAADTGDPISRQVDCDHPDGAALTYTMENAPAGVVISSTGLISGSTNNTGTLRATVIASGAGQTSEMFQTFAIGGSGGADLPPQISSVGAQSSQANQTIAPVQIVASDPQHYALLFEAENLPNGLEMNSSGLITGRPTGADNRTVTVTVTAVTSGLKAEITFLWVVSGDGDDNGGGGGTGTGVTTLFAPSEPFYFRKEELIYRDGLRNGWGQPYGLNTSGSDAYQGTLDIDIFQSATASAGLVSNTGLRQIANYDSLHLFVKSSHDFNVFLWNQANGGGNIASVGNHIVGGWVADTWQKVEMPIGAFSGSQTEFDQMIFRPFNNETDITINLDRIYLVLASSPIDFQIASSEADGLGGVITNGPSGVSLVTTQRSGNSGSAVPVAIPAQTVALDTDSTDAKQGSTGAGLTQEFRLGTVNGEQVVIQQIYEGYSGDVNGSTDPGAPSVNNANHWTGYTEFRFGGSGSGYNRFRLKSLNHDIEAIGWYMSGMTAGPENAIADPSFAHSPSFSVNGQDVDVSFAGIPAGVREVSWLVDSDSSGNNLVAGAKAGNTMTVPASGGGGGGGSSDEVVDTTANGKVGSGPSTTQVYNLTMADGSPLTVTQRYYGIAESGNPGAPATTGVLVDGYTEYSTGGASGYRHNRLEIEVSRAFSALKWGAHGVASNGNEDIESVSHDGTASGMGSGLTGTIDWPSLPAETTKVWVDLISNSDNNRHGFGPIENITVVIDRGTPGEIRLVGTPTDSGVFDAIIQVSDANEVVGDVPFRIVMPSGDDPVIIQIDDQTGADGDAVDLQLEVRNPQNSALEWALENGPGGLSIDDTGRITGTLSGNGIYDVFVTVKDVFGSYDLMRFDCTVNGSNGGLTAGPFITGRISTDPGEREDYSPANARNNLLDVYSKTETSDRDQVVIDTLRDGVGVDLNTFKKLAAAMLNRDDFGEYVLNLINNIDTGDGDLSGIYQLIGVLSSASTLPDFDHIIPNGSSIVAALAALATEVNQLDITQQNGQLSIRGNTVAANFGNGPATPTGRTYPDFISELGLATATALNAAVSPKANQTQVDGLVGQIASLIALTGRNGSPHMGPFTGGVVSDEADLETLIQELINAINLGSGSGTINLDSQTIYGRTLPGNGPGTDLNAGQARSLIGSPSVADMNSAIDAAINALISGSPGALDTLNELAAAMGDDPNFAATVTNALAAKFAKSSGDALVSLSGMAAGSADNGFFPNNIIPSGLKTRQILEQLGLVIKNIQQGNGTWVGNWVTPALNTGITGEGFNDTGGGTSWGAIQWRYIAMSKQIEFKGCIRRPSGSGLGGGTYTMFSVSNVPAKTRMHAIALTDDGGGYRVGMIQILSTGEVQIVGSGWSGAKNIVVNGVVAI